MAEVIKQIMTMPVANVSLLLRFHFLLLFSVFNRVVFQRSHQISLRRPCHPYRPDALPSKYRRKYLVQLPVSFRQPCNKSLCWWYRTLSFIFHLLTTLPPSHIHYFIPGSKLAFSTNLFHHIMSASTHLDCLLPGLYWTGLILIDGFHF